MRKAARKKTRDGIGGSYPALWIATIAGFVAAFAPRAVAEPPPHVRALLAASRDALLPGRTPESVTAIRATGAIERDGIRVGEFETLAERSPRALQETVVLDGVREVVTLLGDEGWVEDPNGAVRSVSGDELSALGLAHALLFHDWLDGEVAGFELTFPDSASDVIRFVPTQPGPERSLRFGKGANGLPNELAGTEQGVEVATSFSDWRVVEGMRFPFVARQSSGDSRFDVVTRTESFTLPASLDGAITRPEPREISDVAWLDRELARNITLKSVGSLLGLDVAVNGGPAQVFLMDTGAGATVLAAETAERLGLARRGVVEARGAGGSEVAGHVDVDALALPGVEIRGQTLVALPLDALAGALGQPIGGILGWDFLSRFVVEIDRVGRRVSLHEARTYSPPPDATRIALRFEANVPRIEGAIEGHAGSLLLDTGNAVPLLLHTDFAASRGFLERATESSFTMAGIGGTTAMREVRVASLALGPLTFEDVPAVLAPDGTGAVALEESVGNVGASLFGDRLLVLDYGGGALWVGPATGTGSTADTADSASAR